MPNPSLIEAIDAAQARHTAAATPHFVMNRGATTDDHRVDGRGGRALPTHWHE